MKIQSRVRLHKQQLWVLAIGILFLADFILCGYWPSHTRLAALKEKRDGYEQTIEMGRAKASHLQAVRARLTGTNETISHYDAYVPQGSSLGTFLTQTSELMTQYQLANQLVVPGKEIPAGELVCIPVHVTGAGELRNIFGFFQGLRSMDRLLRIDRAMLKNDGKFSGRVTMEAEVIIYYRPGKTAADKTAGGANHGA
jgi:Tfp pilus assembly protein PilO